jgi:putative ABC transport system permease protein
VSSLLETLGADCRYALRGLRRNPVFTLTAVVVLGLGLGATTAVFSVMDSVILTDLPYPDPGRLVRVFEQNSATNRWALSTADVLAIREQQRSFEVFGEVQRDEAALSGSGSPERVVVGRASAGFFQAIGVPVARGRQVEAADEAPGAPMVAVVSHDLAERRFGGVDQALGRALTLDGTSYQVVGVLPAGRDELGGMRASVWPALQLQAPTRRGPFWLRGVGRLREGVAIEDARRDLAVISRRLLPVWTDFRDSTAALTPVLLRDSIVGRAGRPVGLFAGAVLLVLLLAITNVATLVLVRASAREPELAVRVMLGAGHGRVARLLVTENLLLTLAAGAAGLALAALGVKLATAFLPNLPRIETVALNWRAVAFALSAALLSGIAVSLSPVAALVRRARGGIQADSRRAGLTRGVHRVRDLLVVAEFALALPLLVGAALLLRSFIRLQQVDPGFDPEGLVAASVSLPPGRYPEYADVQRFWQRAESRLPGIRGAVSGGLATEIPPDNSGNTDNFDLVDHPVPAGEAQPVSPWYYVTTGYFQALGVPVLDGRLFTPADSGNADPVVVVSRSWASKYFPSERAVGRQLIQGGCYSCPKTTIVGVVSDVRNLGPAGAEEAVYGPLTQTNARSVQVVVRTRGTAAEMLRGLRNILGGLDPDLPVGETTLTERFQDSLADPRHWAGMLTAFAAVALGLAALGVFGLMSYVVRQRRREIGVRMALGAQPNAVMWLIIGRGMRFAIIGSCAGLAVTLALAHQVGALLFEVNPTDAGTISSALVVMLVAALLACWIPGRRAARIRPIEAIGAD